MPDIFKINFWIERPNILYVYYIYRVSQLNIEWDIHRGSLRSCQLPVTRDNWFPAAIVDHPTLEIQ